MTSYHFSVTVSGDFEDVVERTKDALSQEGFGVLADLDISATLKTKLDVDIPAYRILGACNPPLANQALGHDPAIGVLLPCNVVVRDQGEGRVLVDFMDPEAVLDVVGNSAIDKVAGEVRTRLEMARDTLARS